MGKILTLKEAITYEDKLVRENYLQWILSYANPNGEDVRDLYKIGEHKDFDWEDVFNLSNQLKAGV